MTHLDELKDAMHSPPDFLPAPLDLQQVMTSGGRLRRRRRFAVAGASALTVAALLIGGSQLAGVGGRADSNPVAAPSAPLPSAGDSSKPEPVPSAGNSSAPGIIGTIVETGRQAEDRRWILYMETSDPHHLDRSLTLILGRTTTGFIDDFDPEITASDPGDGRLAPGFHAVRGGLQLAGRSTPTFGYYVGDAARITARDSATGRTVEAERAPWSSYGGETEAQIFWFDFTEGQTPARFTDISAYDAAGTRLHVHG
ncbi:MAG TPA: hypothetical protein VN408_13190 [Actinoplanes sp.]|nr:hypothetical protein [Actinoplanes sp.]